MKFRRYAAAVLAFFIIACSVPFSSAAAEHVTADGFEYAINEESMTVEITGYDGNADVIYIPAEIEGYPVTSIGSSAFSYNYDIGVLNVPDSVTYIGDYAFYNCKNLMILELPDSIEAMGVSPFRNIGYTESGKSYVDGVFYYGDYLIEANNSISGHCTVKDGTRVIAGEAFYACTSLTGITIPDDTTYIGEGCFRNCNNFAKITIESGNPVYHSAGNCIIETATKTLVLGSCNSRIPADGSVTAIADEAFASLAAPKSIIGSAGLTSISIPEGITKIGDFAFAGCLYLRSVTLPDSLVEVGVNVFADCESLNNIVIPDKMKYIPARMFAFCESLSDFTLSSNVTRIEEGAFIGCNSLDGLKFKGWEELWKSIDIEENNDVLLDKGFVVTYIPEDPKTTDTGFTYIINRASETSKLLKYSGSSLNVNIPESFEGYAVTVIGKEAFSGCKNLRSVTIPQSVTKIEEEAFYRCSSLKSVIIPDNVVSIGKSAFYYCSSLITIKLSSSLKSIGQSAFSHCSALSEIDLPSSLVEIGKSAFSYSGLVKAEIPEGVTTLSEALFQGCASFTTIDFPSTLEIIERDAFHGTAIVEITIPDGITKLNPGLFCRCYNLEKVNLPEGITVVDNYVFMECTSLKEIDLPSTVEKIEYAAFEGSGIVEITLPQSVKELSTRVFANCFSLERVYMPDGLEVIGGHTFSGCIKLTSVVFPAKLKVVESGVLSQTGVVDVTIQRDVESINNNFIYSSSPEKIIYNGTEKQWNALGGFSGTVWREKVIIKGIYGDIDGDFEITATDALLMRRHIAAAEFNEYVNELIADMNDDGRVNAKDMLEIRKLLIK